MAAGTTDTKFRRSTGLTTANSTNKYQKYKSVELGDQLGQLLSITTPGASSRRNCGRPTCFPCNTGHEGVCRRTGVGYKIVCNLCEETISEYAGETGKNLFCRGTEHIADAQRKAADKPLWKHILEKHGGRLSIPIFEHFSMSRTGVFFKPQRRKLMRESEFQI